MEGLNFDDPFSTERCNTRIDSARSLTLGGISKVYAKFFSGSLAIHLNLVHS